ncbi:hypothetical protein [Tenacibaculum finnmarkense]|uniref:hypothetical protein n=1 Tax=Tenacibaculum finnmarkense TaxID=2781243 RepID=UPI00207A2CF6|nr:hypothetical protein [Tenacibaculum finnmarkense]MCM8906826.1 hypothetical protein [Tenacibaculum finnmarkense genomovar finnmarkense]
MIKTILSFLSLNNIKTYLIIASVVTAVIFYKDYQFQKSENIRQSSNNRQLRKYDSLKFASQTYSKQELDEYLEYTRKDLQEFLKKNKISTRRIESIISQQLKYKDTTSKTVNLQPILDAINSKKDIKLPVIDSTKCMIIKGYVAFKNDTLDLKITDRQFKNRTDVVKYWERRQWKFLGIKTRVFGRKEVTLIIKDDCGKTETFIINKRQI